MNQTTKKRPQQEPQGSTGCTISQNQSTNPNQQQTKKSNIGQPSLSTSVFNIQPLLDKNDDGGVLDDPEILDLSNVLEACVTVGDWCETLDRNDHLSLCVIDDSTTTNNNNNQDTTIRFQQIRSIHTHRRISPHTPFYRI